MVKLSLRPARAPGQSRRDAPAGPQSVHNRAAATLDSAWAGDCGDRQASARPCSTCKIRLQLLGRTAIRAPIPIEPSREFRLQHKRTAWIVVDRGCTVVARVQNADVGEALSIARTAFPEFPDGELLLILRRKASSIWRAESEGAVLLTQQSCAKQGLTAQLILEWEVQRLQAGIYLHRTSESALNRLQKLTKAGLMEREFPERPVKGGYRLSAAWPRRPFGRGGHGSRCKVNVRIQIRIRKGRRYLAGMFAKFGLPLLALPKVSTADCWSR